MVENIIAKHNVSAFTFHFLSSNIKQYDKIFCVFTSIRKKLFYFELQIQIIPSFQNLMSIRKYFLELSVNAIRNNCKYCGLMHHLQ